MRTTHRYSRLFLSCAASWMLLMVSGAPVKAESAEAVLKSANVERIGGRMHVNMLLDLSELELGSNRTAVFTPVLLNGSDSLTLDPLAIYGRTRWFQYLRSGAKPLGGPRATGMRYSERPSEYMFEANVPYSEWMNGAELLLRRSEYGCCGELESSRTLVAGGFEEIIVEYAAVYRYVQPEAVAVKTSSLSGKAYIDFRSGKSDIDAAYGRNAAELGKITATIDSIRRDSDITVTSIAIKGYASPEGKYSLNEKLAKGRTESLKNYVQKQYSFDPSLLSTDYVAEDWDGLRSWVEASTLPHKAELLSIIDSDLEIDTKDWRMKLRYPEDYAVMLKEAYPSLRHSDYKIEYTVRKYGEPSEIAEVLRTRPQNLSLEEMFVLAQTLEPGSAEFDAVFETAVRMYPGDASANLNAANAAMARGDLSAAAKYLDKAGDSAEAVYARGVLCALNGDYDKAMEHVSKAGAKGLDGTREVLEHLGQVKASKR